LQYELIILNFSELKSRQGGLYFEIYEKKIINNGINMQAVASIALEALELSLKLLLCAQAT